MRAESSSDRELLLLHLSTMFVFDTQGRMAAVNEPGLPPPPRIFIASTASDRVIRVGARVPERVAREWLRCATDEQIANSVKAHQPIEREHRGPAFVLPELLGPTDEAILPVTGSHPLHPELVARGWKFGESGPYLGAVREGVVVAVCFSSRVGEHACAAGVETASSYRGQGLGESVVRAWAAAVQATGKLALYSTSWENEASRRIAAKLAARHFGEDWHLT
ncbi:MAG: GNAT family N-acetyltransferase [bacterium]